MNAARRLLPWVVGMAALVGALYLGHRELSHYDLRTLLAAAKAIPLPRIAAALGATVASYLLLTLYDVLALRHVGHRLSYAKTAATSFASYVASHNIGLGGLGGTAVRYRLYTAFGLAAPEIAEVVASCALAFWAGLFALGGVVFTVAPVALPAQLHAFFATTRPLGVLFAAITVLLFCWSLVVRRQLAWRSFTFTPPSGRMLLAQLPLAALDWTFAAGVLFVLLPSGHGISFWQVFSVFLVAQAVGLVSHVPAGLGVFEAVVLQLLPGDVATPQLVGALLVYRAVYYVVPLAVGAVVLLAMEASLRRTQVAKLFRGIAPIGALLVPRLLALTTFAGGCVLLFTGSLPAQGERMAWLSDVVPLPLVEVSHFLGSLVGAGLLVLSRAVQKRVDAAWWTTVALLGAGIVLVLLRGLDYEEATLLLSLIVVMILFRSAFTRRAALFHAVLSSGWWLDVVLVVTGTLWLGLLAFRHVEYSHELWWRFAADQDAPRFLRASVGMLGVLVVFGAMRLLRAVPPSLAAPTDDDLTRVRAILAGEQETLGHLALMRDKQLLFDEARTAFVMFAVRGASWVALGDPVGGSEAAKRELIWRFCELAERSGGRPVFYQVSEERLGWYAETGSSLLKIGEEARVDLASFTLEGGLHKGLRTNRHRLQREGITFEVLSSERARASLAELAAISDAWLATKATREKGFSLGAFRPDYVLAGPVAVVRREARLLAFADVWLGAKGGEFSVDLMRHADDAPGGLMDLMFTELFAWGRAEGYRWFSLGVAPLAGLEQRRGSPVWNRVAGLLFRHGEHFYGFQGLRQYKAKFHPAWRARYLAAPGGLALPSVLFDVITLISGGVTATWRR